ncbi:MAG: hypothetical protein ACYCWE_02835 [Eubacteriales bacterium]
MRNNGVYTIFGVAITMMHGNFEGYSNDHRITDIMELHNSIAIKK